jgi:hypothetical protein
MDDAKRRERAEGAEIEVKCRVCKERVRVSEKDAREKMSVRCSKGHEIPLVRMM